MHAMHCCEEQFLTIKTLVKVKNSHFTYSWLFDSDIFDKICYLFVPVGYESVWYQDDIELFMHAFWLLWKWPFIPGKPWSKSNIHILVEFWWWDFWPKISLFYRLLQENKKSEQDDIIFWYFCACLFITMEKSF